MVTYCIQDLHIGLQAADQVYAAIQIHCRSVPSWGAHGIALPPGIEARVVDLDARDNLVTIVSSNCISETEVKR